MSSPELQRRLIRLAPLSFSALPPHPGLAEKAQQGNNNATSRPDLGDFIKEAITEAETLLSDTIHTFKVDKKLRCSPPSVAKVQLSSRAIPVSSSNAPNGERQKNNGDEEEFWVCRKSVHVDTPEEGTASWNEFESGLRFDHSQNEMDYTPSVSGVESLLEWKHIDIGETLRRRGWTGVDMHVNMITHTFHPSALISPRTFITCVISALHTDSSTTADDQSSVSSAASSVDSTEHDEKEFITIQIPIQAPSNASSEFTDPSISSKFSTLPKNTIFAYYASVERVRSLPPNINIIKSPRPSVDTSRGRSGSVAGGPFSPGPRTRTSLPAEVRSRLIEWTMATTSDAGGLIPSWVQRSWTMGGVPKAVVADVGLFLGWVEKRRTGQEMQ